MEVAGVLGRAQARFVGSREEALMDPEELGEREHLLVLLFAAGHRSSGLSFETKVADVRVVFSF